MSLRDEKQKIFFLKSLVSQAEILRHFHIPYSIFHITSVICHCALRAVPAMTNDRCNMEYGRWKMITPRNFCVSAYWSGFRAGGSEGEGEAAPSSRRAWRTLLSRVNSALARSASFGLFARL